MSRTPRPAAPPPASRLIADYRPLPGVPDEMIDRAGNVMPGWEQLLGAFETLGEEELGHRFARADQYLRDAGVFYRSYDGTKASDREWPLAHVPLLLDEGEWRLIAAGIAQRAELLEAVVADIYGEARLVREGLLPPALVAGNPEFLRPLAGVRPAGGKFLNFCAFELGRGPNGQWWVLGDRVQAPSGAGFALENRVATTRALADVYGQMNVHRLAGFFKEFRDALNGQMRGQGERVGILTPGPHNETYYEHAYIARYLGFMLLEGEDLTVSEGRLMVRTVSGPRPVSVLWRRLDAAFADPLELNADSALGTPGFVEAVRDGAVLVVNALGAGVAEARALAAFLPGIAEALTGQGLELPCLATWWCGHEAARAHVMEKLDTMMVGPALAATLPFEDAEETVLGAALDADARAALAARIAADPGGFVGQEAVRLSTAPVYRDGRLTPRPVILRVFAARTPEGWTVMPGGFARVGLSADTTAFAMRRGGQAADVWVVSTGRVEQVTLLPKSDLPFVRNLPGPLPARAADNLFWLGRYTERCECLVRVLRAYHARLAETGSADMPVLADLRAYLETLELSAEPAIPEGLTSAVAGAVGSAGRVRDRFSPDGWLALRDLDKTLDRFAGRVQPGDDAARAMTVILRKLAGFSGLIHENMYRFTGWRFLEIGRRIERATEMLRLTAHLIRDEAPDGALDMLLEIGDSVLTHRRRYNVSTARETVADLLILDALNPRAVRFQLAALRQEIEQLPGGAADGQLSQIAKETLRIETELAVADPGSMTPELLRELWLGVESLATLLALEYTG